MSKLTAKKIKKCRKFIKTFKRYKRHIEKVDGRKYSYSEINTTHHMLRCNFWMGGIDC